MKRYVLLCMTVFLALAGGLACAQEKPLIRIGAKVFSEQRILAQMTAQYLQSKGYRTRVVAGLGSTVARSAQENNELDLNWEYTGTSLFAYNNQTEVLPPEASLARVRELDGAKGLVWLEPSRFSNTYALAVPREVAERDGVRTISDLTRVINATDEPHLIAFDIEFANRPDGLTPLVERYGLSLTRNEVRQMDPGLVYTALRNAQVYAGLVYTTDGRLDAFDLHLLEDDRQHFPDYTAAPVVRRDVLDANPELAGLLASLARLLDDDTMRALNARVDIGHETPAAVAADFLRQHELI
ncbi:glycine/betaine ABC transporter substrate-binding protein [Stutzerimonas nosocomialis]|uniref:glycine betaine ABC transporter substrate-binding protein n=1 Tax=Stutzerimonas nosocomialis TaxID=1056496 RepID=UPI0011099193|nr:glycine betaine ABC transporter substrate-binding protein [Stutzerimonas nosocomialis]TLX53288.1 glycine/betaine ABC transporter substrate-binding protein [Stutzerimonas nosocomialis]